MGATRRSIKTFERFTERGRDVVIRAQEEAKSREADRITSGHLYAGLYTTPQGRAQRAMMESGFHPDVIDALVEQFKDESLPEGWQDRKDGTLPFTPDAKKALELALREALGLGHNWIGTEHILLGLMRLHGDTIKAFSPAETREALMRELQGPQAKSKRKKDYLVVPAQHYRVVSASSPEEAMKLAGEKWPDDVSGLVVALQGDAWRGRLEEDRVVRVEGLEAA